MSNLGIIVGINVGLSFIIHFLLWWWLRREVDKLQAMAVLSRREQSATIAKITQSATSMQHTAKQLQQEARMLSWHIQTRG